MSPYSATMSGEERRARGRDAMRRYRARQRILHPPAPREPIGPLEVYRRTVVRFLAAYESAERTATGCVLWPRSVRGRYGYGQMFAFGTVHPAHRVAAAIFLGVPIDSPSCILHRCDTPRCVNPEHLFLGTKTDNARDRDTKGRTVRGSQHGSAKLTEDIIPLIREEIAEGSTLASIARELDVCRATIRHIRDRKTWRHVA